MTLRVAVSDQDIRKLMDLAAKSRAQLGRQLGRSYWSVEDEASFLLSIAISRKLAEEERMVRREA